MQRLQILGRFIRFFFKATTQYGVHSPFVFEFTQKVLDDDRQFYAFPLLETLRDYMKRDTTAVSVSDFGAGSQVLSQKTRSIKAIANSSLSSPLYCRMLFQMVHWFKPRTILELGTSLGLSTLYLSKGAAKAQVITLEGCPNIAQIARNNFQRLEASNIDLRTGVFAQTLAPALADLQELDFAFIDGNHREKATLHYFQQCLDKATENSVFVFDDIHWSTEMEAAWEKIKARQEVTLTIDLFFMGVVFFRSDFKVKQHFQLVPKSWKPWIFGFFNA